jgi:hypothetical protein
MSFLIIVDDLCGGSCRGVMHHSMDGFFCKEDYAVFDPARVEEDGGECVGLYVHYRYDKTQSQDGWTVLRKRFYHAGKK